MSQPRVTEVPVLDTPSVDVYYKKHKSTTRLQRKRIHLFVYLLRGGTYHSIITTFPNVL